MAARGGAGIQRPGAAGGGGRESRRSAQRPRRRQARSERCMVAGAGSTAGAGGAAGPPRTSVMVPEAPPRQSAAAGAAPSAECGPGRLCPAWEKLGKPACPGRRAAGRALRQRFPHEGKKSMNLFCLTEGFSRVYKTLFTPS